MTKEVAIEASKIRSTVALFKILKWLECIFVITFLASFPAITVLGAVKSARLAFLSTLFLLITFLTHQVMHASIQRRYLKGWLDRWSEFEVDVRENVLEFPAYADPPLLPGQIGFQWAVVGLVSFIVVSLVFATMVGK